MEGLCWPETSVEAEFEPHIQLLLAPTSELFDLGRTAYSYRIPAPRNMNWFEVQTVVTAFKAFANAVELGGNVWLMAPYMWCDHQLRRFKVLEFHSKCSARFELRTSS